TIFRSKAIGEPPLMLAISVWLAIRDAIASLADHRLAPRLDAPATPERVLAAVEELRARRKGQRAEASAIHRCGAIPSIRHIRPYTRCCVGDRRRVSVAVPMQPIISVSNVSKTYASGLRALERVNLDIRRGEIFALLGPNGAGKTTLISIICGIVTLTEGTVTVAG